MLNLMYDYEISKPTRLLAAINCTSHVMWT